MEKEPIIQDIAKIPQPTVGDTIKSALASYGWVAFIIAVLTAYIALNDKLNDLNRSVGRLEGKIEILQQLKPTP